MAKPNFNFGANAAAWEAQASQIRRTIRAARLRVELDKERGRETPDAVIRIANRKMPVSSIPRRVPTANTATKPQQMAAG